MKLKKTHLLTLAIALLSSINSAFASDSELPENVRASEFSLSRNALAIEGYDPVAYFQSGPTKGDKDHSLTYRGVTYQFASAENLETFRASPETYEPQYGGWCAWAMYDGGGRTEPNPKSFKIVDGKLYLFYDGFFGDTLKLWNDQIAESPEDTLITRADNYWDGQVR